MITYRRYLRAYAWAIVTAFLVVGLLRAGMGVGGDDPQTWEMLPDACQNTISCTVNNPSR